MNHELLGRIYETALSPGDWVALLEALADWSANASTSPELDALLEHLDRAVRSSARLHQLEDQNHLFSRLYHSMPWPLLMLAEDMSVVSGNLAARQSLGPDAPLHWRADNGLHFRDNALQQALQEVVQLARGRHLQIVSVDSSPLTLLCMPFEKSDADGHIARVRTIVWVLSSQPVVVPSAESLQAIFKLSQAESRLVHLLCKVGNLNQCAELLSISIHTARSQLKAVMGKTNMHSQVQLVSQAMSLSLLQSRQNPLSAQAEVMEHTMTLKDGRLLSWYEYGAARGRPVLALENIGSSIPDHERFADWYRAQNVRVIVPVRPGYGISTARPGFQFRDFAGDLLALCQHLNLHRPILAGYCCGGAYALCAAALKPDAFDRVGVLASTVPIAHFDMSRLDRLHRMFLQIFRRDPRLFVMLGKLAWRGAQQAPEKYLRQVGRSAGGRDEALLNDPAILQAIIRQMRLRHFQGARAQIDEYLNLQHPWQVDLGQIRIPTTIWHGRDDAIISVGSAEAMAREIPGARFRSLPGHGHFLVFDVWTEFLGDLLSAASACDAAHNTPLTPLK